MTLLIESFSVLSRRVYENLKINHKKLFASLPIALLLVTPSPLKSEYVVSNTPVSGNEQAVVELRTDHPLAVLPVNKVSAIVPGESVNGRELRLQAEAVAQAVAQKLAAKKVTITQQSTSVSTVADPANFDDLYRSAGSAFGVDPMLIKAIHIVETGASGSTSRSNPSGATGPMQFLPSTFRNHSVDGNTDGVKDIHNVSDAVFSAAKYLRACGYPDLKKALWGYNPSTSYYTKVLKLARSLGFQG
ncbi:MAG TPA: lytic transglycosylase domain-containing protein [Patescibacteria group bacterium]|nr:lytic transglycosylase domain-containing protein [Patescibacteria group bacterium]